jgi:hypothetical protein
MHKPSFTFAILYLLLISGCSNAPVNIWYTSTADLIKQHDYQKAIAQIHSDKPVNAALLSDAHAFAKQYFSQQSQQIHRLIKAQEWGQARSIMRHLALTQPNNTSLDHLENSIDQAQTEEERLLNTRWYLAEADRLDIQLKQQALSDRIHHDRFNWFDQSQHLQEQKQQLAETLLHLSTQALQVKDYGNAQLAYEKAIEFDKQLGKGELKQAIKTGLSLKNDKAIQQRQHSLIKQLAKAIRKLDFKHILVIQEILSHEPFHGPKVKQALNNAQQLRQDHAQTLDHQAGKLYRQGSILKSVTLWGMALKLTPTNTNLKEKLLRAEKVQRKLEKLSSSGIH